MKKLYVEIEERYRDAELERLLGELQKEGIEILRLSTLLMDSRKAADQSLLLTDSQETADRAAERDIACVGYEPPGTEIRLSHVDMVIQGLEELSPEFFRLIYRRHHGLPWTIAETERLWIRESVPGDFDALYAMYREPGMTDYMPGMERGREEEKNLFEAYIRRMYPFFSYGLWTVIEKDSGTMIGRAGLENGTYRGEPVLELGYMIGGTYRHHGYGLEAVTAIIDYAETAVGAEKVYAFIREENGASRRLIQRAGFTEVEKEREGICVYVREKA